MNWMRFGFTLLLGSLVVGAVAVMFYVAMSEDTAATLVYFGSMPTVLALCALGAFAGLAAMIGHARR